MYINQINVYGQLIYIHISGEREKEVVIAFVYLSYKYYKHIYNLYLYMCKQEERR